MLAHLTDISLRSILLAIVATMVLWTLRRTSTAAFQHAVWASVTCGMLSLFAFGQYLPQLPLRLLKAPVATTQSPLTFLRTAPLISRTQPAEIPLPVNSTHTRTALHTSWLDAILYLYFSIALASLLRFFAGMFFARRLLAQSTPATGGRGEGDFLESPRISVPVTIGWLRPRIVLPMEWRDWEREKLAAVLLHEGAHVTRRDGLIAALAHINRCFFCFHPVAWLLARRVTLLAEQACDEAAAAALGNRERYASVLLEMASVRDESQGRLRHHVLTMASASHIRQRIESLLKAARPHSQVLSRPRRIALAVCGIPVVLLAGAVEVTRQVTEKQPPPVSPPLQRQLPDPKPILLAQAATVPPVLPTPAPIPAPPSPAFDLASVRPTEHGRDANGLSISYVDVPTPGDLVARNSSLDELIRFAWNLKDYQVSGPVWLNDDNECFDILAKATRTSSRDQMRVMMRRLLEERFNMAAHQENKILPVYELVVSKNGSKLKSATPEEKSNTWSSGGIMRATSITMPEFAYQLSRELKRGVLDKTGATGAFDFTLDFGQEHDPAVLPPVFTSIQDTLGLKLESAKEPLDILVVDHIDRLPTAN